MAPSLKKLLYFPLTRIVIGIVACLAILVGAQHFITKPLSHWLFTSKAAADAVRNCASVAVLLASYFYLFRAYEKRKITELSPRKAPIELTGGFFLGFAMMSLVILALYFLGYYHAMGIPDYSYLLAPFSFVIVAALFEEVFFRLIAYRILEEWLGTYWALALICIMFTVPHLFNNHLSALAILIIPLFSFAVSLMYSYTKRLWLPFAFHLGWNFALPFYGSNLSGEEGVGQLIRARFDGPPLLTGSAFGLEDSLFTAILLVALSAALLYLCMHHHKILSTAQAKAIPKNNG